MTTHRVMRPYDYDPKHLVLPCYISPKMDGVRGFRGRLGMTFRSGKPIWGVEHIYRYIPATMMLDGEMLIPGMPFQKSAGLIRSHDPTPDAHLYIFDHMNSELTFMSRYARLEDFTFFSNNIHVIKHTLVYTVEDMMTIHNSYIDLGFEGSVIKTPHHLYQLKKSWDWMRIVPEKSIDAKVVSMYEGKGKYIGMLGGVRCEGEGLKVKVGTGFDDFQRVDFWSHPAKILEQTIRIKYKEKTADGSLRHPSFDRIRYHK